MRKFAVLVSLVIAVSLYAGAPLKGVDVKLGKNPGGTPAARATDASGNFDFGVMPKGSYALQIAPDRRGGTAQVALRGSGTVTTYRWNLAAGRRARASNERAAADDDRIVIASDGQHAIGGTITGD